jgi:hypothetical protein
MAFSAFISSLLKTQSAVIKFDLAQPVTEISLQLSKKYPGASTIFFKYIFEAFLLDVKYRAI